MDPETAKAIQKLAGESGKTFQSVAPEEDPSAKAKNINQTLGQMNILSQAPYFNPDRVLDYGRRDAGSEVELYDPETRMAVARIAREPKEDKKPIFWQSNSYDPNLDYDSVNKGTHISLVDPTTQKEVARMVNIAGGSGEPDETPNPTPNSENNEDDPYANMSFVQLVQEIGKKRQLLSEFEARLNRLPVLRTAANNARLADMRGEVMNLDTEMQLLMTENEEDKLAFEQFDALVEQEVDYRLREGKDFSTAMHQEKLAYDDLQAFLSAETEDMPNILSNPRLAGALKARYAYLMAEYKSQFPDQLSTESGAAAPAPEPSPTTTPPDTTAPTPGPIDDAERRHREQLELQERLHQEQMIILAESRKAAAGKDYPHDEALSDPDADKRRKYIEDLLYDYEHFRNGVTADDVKKIREAMTRLKIDKEIIDVLDARKMLQEASGFVPIEGAINIDKWEESMKGLFVAEAYPLKLLIGGDWVRKENGDVVDDPQTITEDLQRPSPDRTLEWKRKELIPGLNDALNLLQTETHTEIMEVDKIDFSTTPPRLIPGQKEKIPVNCNFFQGDSSQSNVSIVKKIYEGKLRVIRSDLDSKKIETAIHLAERLLRVTLIGARMNGPLRSDDNYTAEEYWNLAQRRIDLSLTNDKDNGKNSIDVIATLKGVEDLFNSPDDKIRRIDPPLTKQQAVEIIKQGGSILLDSEWDKVYRGTHPSIKLDTDGKVSGPTKGRGTVFRELLYFPAFLMQRNVGGYPELRRLANLRASDLFSHLTDAAYGIKAGVGEITDFDQFIKVYSVGSFANKQNVLNYWVDNVKNAMDKRGLFYSDPKESGKGTSGLIADPISASTRDKILDQSLDYLDTKNDATKASSDTRAALEKFQKSLVEFGAEFASKYNVVYAGVPKEKAKNLIWLEQQFVEFISSKDIGHKYFVHRNAKRKGQNIYFYLGQIGRDAFTYGFYKSEILQNITDVVDAEIAKLRMQAMDNLEPNQVPTGENWLTNGGSIFNIGLRWLGGDKPKK